MTSGVLRYIVICCFIVSFLSMGSVYTSAQEELTRGDFIVKLVNSMGLADKVKEDAKIADYVELLRKEGIKIPSDFDTSKIISAQERADLLNQALTVTKKIEEKPKVLAEAYRDKAIVKKIVGSVTVKPEGETAWIPAKLDMGLTQGAYIKTAKDSTVSLRVGVAGRILIKENTELQLQTLTTQPDKVSENIMLYLATGEVFVDVRDIANGSTFETHTPTTVAAVRGTTYVIKVEPVSGKTEVKEAVK